MCLHALMYAAATYPVAMCLFGWRVATFDLSGRLRAWLLVVSVGAVGRQKKCRVRSLAIFFASPSRNRHQATR